MGHHCHPRTRPDLRALPTTTVAWAPRAPERPEQRVGDQQRTAAEEVVGQAFALGYLDVAELDTRLDRLAAAHTVGELRAVTADLPVEQLERSSPARQARRSSRVRRGLAAHGLAYLFFTLVGLVVWLVVALATQAWYPWPVWPALGGGLGLTAHALAVRGHLRCPAPRALLP